MYNGIVMGFFNNTDIELNWLKEKPTGNHDFDHIYGGFLQIVAYTKIGNVAIVGCLGVCHPFMVIRGVVYYCFTNIALH